MPVLSAARVAPGKVVSIDLSIRRSDLLHFLGYRNGREPGARIEEQIGEVLGEARGLARGQGVYVELPVEAAPSVGLAVEPADALVIGLVTAGGGIEERASEKLRTGEMTHALLLDAAGSAAAEEAADRLSAWIFGDDSDAAHPVSCRISPGYGRWKIDAQRAIFDRIPHADLGVELTPTFLMVPRKSISFALWLGAPTRPSAGLSGCARCSLDHCRYRRDAFKGDTP